jgi:fermentation-respiration switch protein FrsA (DUF1100 family)
VALLLRLGVVLLVCYLALCVLVYFTQAKLVWFPGAAPRTTPGDLGLEFREVELVAEDGVRLHGWFLPCESARGVVLVCHGNAGSIEYRIDVARAFLGMGCAVLLFDYRGYGRSGGAPDEEGTYLDAVAAHAHLTAVEGFAAERIVLYGESLGAAVAIELARRRTVAALVAESAFTSVPDVGAEVYPFLPVRLLARIRYDNRAKLPELAVPLLLVHSPDDEIVPVAHAHRLLAAAREPRELLLTGGGHNDGGFRLRAEWRAEVAAFVAAALR